MIKVYLVIGTELYFLDVDETSTSPVKKGVVTDRQQLILDGPPPPPPKRITMDLDDPDWEETCKRRVFRVKMLQSYQREGMGARSLHMLETYALEFHEWIRGKLNGAAQRPVPLSGRFYQFWKEHHPNRKIHTGIVYGVAHTGWRGKLWEIKDEKGTETFLELKA